MIALYNPDTNTTSPASLDKIARSRAKTLVINPSDRGQRTEVLDLEIYFEVGVRGYFRR